MNPAITFKNNEQLHQEEVQKIERQRAMERQYMPVITSLSSHVTTCWDAARRAKEKVADDMLKSKRMLSRQYEPEKLQKIRALGGSEIYMGLADEKATAAKAWLIDILLPADQEPFGVDHSPVPELPPDQQAAIQQQVMQQAQMDMQLGVVSSQADVISKIKAIQGVIQQQLRKKAREVESAVENKIKDVIVESNWRDAIKEFISNLVDYKAGILKGPVFRMRREITRDQAGNPMIQPKIIMEFDAPSPFDIYPAPSSRGPNDGYIIEKHSLTRNDLVALKGVKGYDKVAIDLVLRDYGAGGLRRWIYETHQNEVDRLSYRSQADLDPEGKIDTLQFSGSVQGMWLVEHGVDASRIPDVFEEYEAEVWQIGRYVIKAALNESPCSARGYYVTSFRKRPGQFWGDGVPDLLVDIQDMCNAAARNLVNNMGITSGPQIGIDIDAMPQGSTLTNLQPMQIHQFKMGNIQNGTRPPIWFFQPQSMTEKLLKVYEFFSTEADNKTGIPKYSYGQQGGGGAIGTATGLSMMMTNASRTIKLVISNIDEVIRDSVEMVYRYLVIHDPDPILRAGDVKLIARGSTALIAKEQQQIRRAEALNVLLDPRVLEIIGKDGLAEYLRHFIQGLDMGTDDIVPSKDEMMRQLVFQNMQQGQGPGMPQKATTPNQAGDRQGGADARLQ